MFDTNAFNRLLDPGIDISIFKGRVDIFATHIQLRELHATTDTQRRQALESSFHEITTQTLPTESMVLPIKLGSAKFGDGTYELILAKLNGKANSFRGRKRNNKLRSNPADAQIGEVALKNGHVLVTDDPELFSVVKDCGGTVLRFDDFVKEIGLSTAVPGIT